VLLELHFFYFLFLFNFFLISYQDLDIYLSWCLLLNHYYLLVSRIILLVIYCFFKINYLFVSWLICLVSLVINCWLKMNCIFVFLCLLTYYWLKMNYLLLSRIITLLIYCRLIYLLLSRIIYIVTVHVYSFINYQFLHLEALSECISFLFLTSIRITNLSRMPFGY